MDKVRQTYTLMHTHQTVDFVKEKVSNLFYSLMLIVIPGGEFSVQRSIQERAA